MLDLGMRHTRMIGELTTMSAGTKVESVQNTNSLRSDRWKAGAVEI